MKTSNWISNTQALLVIFNSKPQHELQLSIGAELHTRGGIRIGIILLEQLLKASLHLLKKIFQLLMLAAIRVSIWVVKEFTRTFRLSAVSAAANIFLSVWSSRLSSPISASSFVNFFYFIFLKVAIIPKV